jgi:hypothetical protein
VQPIRKRLTYANVMSSIAVFLVLGGGAAFAATKIGANQLKANSVKTGKIVKEAVTTSKIKQNAINTSKIANDAVTGEKVNEGTLGTVPSATNATNATNATTAANLTGQTPFLFRLGFGQERLIASHGSVSLTAVCDQSGGNDRARILMATSQNGAVANGTDAFSGNAGKFLETTSPPDEREFVVVTAPTGQTNVSVDIDEGFVLGPDDKMLTANSEGLGLGVNYRNVGCVFGGIANAVG